MNDDYFVSDLKAFPKFGTLEKVAGKIHHTVKSRGRWGIVLKINISSKGLRKAGYIFCPDYGKTIIRMGGAMGFPTADNSDFLPALCQQLQK